MKAKDTPMKAAVEDGDLVIRIGADRLSYCALAKNGGSLPPKVRVINALGFAHDVARTLNRDEEDGGSDVQRLFAGACLDAAVNGSMHVDWPIYKANIASQPRR